MNLLSPLMTDAQKITVETTVNTPIETAWECWTNPDHVMKWNHASDDWHSPSGTNDLREGGTFVFRMEAKDGSFGFDFGGTYTKVIEHREIEYVMDDNRRVHVTFESQDGSTYIRETFDAETENSPEMQKEGWQAILDNYKKHTEAQVQ